MLRIAGCGIIVMITALIGNYFSANLNNRLLYLKKINYMLDEITILIRYKTATVYEIIEHLSKDERFISLDFIKICRSNLGYSIPFNKIWNESVSCTEIKCLLNEDINFIKSIGQNLGNSDSEGQFSTLLLEKEELSALIDSSNKDYISKGKLYRTLGVLSGAFISIIII